MSSEANKQAFEGMQTVLTRQGEILRQTMDDATAAIKELSAAGSAPDVAAKQAELLDAFRRRAPTG